MASLILQDRRNAFAVDVGPSKFKSHQRTFFKFPFYTSWGRASSRTAAFGNVRAKLSWGPYWRYISHIQGGLS